VAVQLENAIRKLEEWGEPAYRRTQVRHAVTRDLVGSWEGVSTMPKALRTRLEEAVHFADLVSEDVQRSSDGTVKARFRTRDGFPVETVLMVHGDRRAVCVSSQSGCALACTFCATGTMGLGRNLDAGEIFEQLLWAAREAKRDGARIANVVLMGMGEPFHNYDNVLEFCRTANDPDGFGLGARSMAISTAGWIPGIDRLAAEPLQVKLALSLHAPNDEIRARLMPVNKRFPVAEVMAACQRYREETRRRIFIEYLLLDGVNDAPDQANELASLLHRTAPGGFHVNLIVYNPTGSEFRASKPEAIGMFKSILERRGIDQSLRQSRGRDIDAACGQLAVKGVKERRDALRAERSAARS
jgi:23S rRNA (adenine2503-C2)-methyltransferase